MLCNVTECEHCHRNVKIVCCSAPNRWLKANKCRWLELLQVDSTDALNIKTMADAISMFENNFCRLLRFCDNFLWSFSPRCKHFLSCLFMKFSLKQQSGVPDVNIKLLWHNRATSETDICLPNTDLQMGNICKKGWHQEIPMLTHKVKQTQPQIKWLKVPFKL